MSSIATLNTQDLTLDDLRDVLDADVEEFETEDVTRNQWVVRGVAREDFVVVDDCNGNGYRSTFKANSGLNYKLDQVIAYIGYYPNAVHVFDRLLSGNRLKRDDISYIWTDTEEPFMHWSVRWFLRILNSRRMHLGITKH
jgi:hypothetical protein